jgi:hypothetical protein
MFGYVTICKPELKIKDWYRYKAYYCGLCRTLRERNGHLGQMTLTYDMTFTVILLTSLYECAGVESMHRCKVHPVKKQRMLCNEITEYCADMNFLLSYYHMKDDWDDEKKVAGLVGAGAMRRKAEQIARSYPRQNRAICSGLKELAGYEKRGLQNVDIMAGCFGRLMEEVFIYKKDVWEESLRTMAFFLGKFIYIMDAYEDLEEDERTGRYNPLKALHREDDYEEKCRRMLTMMIGEASAAFERLPCLLDEEILRNILYAGVWTKYRQMRKEGKEQSC